MDQLTLLPEDPPARTSPLEVSVLAWLESVRASSGTSAGSQTKSKPRGSSGRTSLAHSHPIAVPISPPCCGGSLDAGPRCPRTGGSPLECVSALAAPPSGGCWTLKVSELPNDVVVSSLSQVLEANVDPRFFLSAKTAAGILERSARRGGKLPPLLEEALKGMLG